MDTKDKYAIKQTKNKIFGKKDLAYLLDGWKYKFLFVFLFIVLRKGLTM